MSEKFTNIDKIERLLASIDEKQQTIDALNKMVRIQIEGKEELAEEVRRLRDRIQYLEKFLIV